jgi:hypothetical protein
MDICIPRMLKVPVTFLFETSVQKGMNAETAPTFAGMPPHRVRLNACHEVGGEARI